MNKRIFITGTDTDCGKTFYTCHLAKSLSAQGFKVKALKPIASGAEFIENQFKSHDALQVSAASNITLPYELTNPFCFEPPIAPHIAANEVGEALSVNKIVQHINMVDHEYPSDYTIIEGVGGWLVPLNETENIADVADALNADVRLVVGMKLGCINHALLSAESIKARGVAFEGWIANCIEPDMLCLQENISTLTGLIFAPLLEIM